jgi:hypothetical protein
MRAGHVRGVPGAVAEDLAALLSQALLSFTLEYEEGSVLSLAMSADVVRVLSADGVPVRDLPPRSGVSKEAITAAVGLLQRNGYAAVEPDRLAKALITGRRLALGLQPYPDGWRAARNPYRARTQAVLADPASALPRYPMVLHRGGYPDGS